MKTKSFVLSVLVGAGSVAAANSFAQCIERVSLRCDGSQTASGSSDARVSRNGRYVVFGSMDNQVVCPDNLPFSDIFVRDMKSRATVLISLDPSTGTQADQPSYLPRLSQDGRFVSFQSNATNLPGAVPGRQIYVHDRDTDADGIFDEPGAATIVAVPVAIPAAAHDASDNGLHVALTADADSPADGHCDIQRYDLSSGQLLNASQGGNSDSVSPSLSATGDRVAFASLADNLIPGDNNGTSDVFVYDFSTGVRVRASEDATGIGGDQVSGTQGIAISADGRHVAFNSSATNLVAGDANGAPDVFVYDVQTGELVRVSVSSTGLEADGGSSWPSVSRDGRFVSFQSTAKNLGNPAGNGVYRHDRDADQNGIFDEPGGILTTLIVDSNGQPAPAAQADLSNDGRFLVFESSVPLVPGDTNNTKDVYRSGPQLVLEALPTSVAPLETLTFCVWDGTPATAVLIFAIEAGGVPVFQLIFSGVFGVDGTFGSGAVVPVGLSGVEASFLAFASGKSGGTALSNVETVTFQ